METPKRPRSPSPTSTLRRSTRRKTGQTKNDPAIAESSVTASPAPAPAAVENPSPPAAAAADAPATNEVLVNQKSKDRNTPRDSRRTKGRSSDESTASTSTALTTTTAITSAPGTPKPQIMAAPSFDNYYLGRLGNAKLLARSNRAPWQAPFHIAEDPSFSGPALKRVFVVERSHSLAAKLENGLSENILRVLGTMQPCAWVSVHYLRLGYDTKIRANNPVVALVTVKENQISPAEAQRVVDGIHAECVKAEVSDVEAEIMEGHPATPYDDTGEQLPIPSAYPYPGASIAMSSQHKSADIPCGSGTLGGYLEVGGKVMGLTCHHVLFGNDRMVPFPTDQEKAAAATYTAMQPSERDLEERLSQLDRAIRDFEQLKGQYNEKRRQDALAVIHDEANAFKKWTPEASVLGHVGQTSGCRVRTAASGPHCRLDWGLIELDNPQRFVGPDTFENKLPHPVDTRRTNSALYRNAALDLMGPNRSVASIPTALHRALSFKEMMAKVDLADGQEWSHVVWKIGRSTHITYGILSGIKSSHQNANGLVTDELFAVDNDKVVFSDLGDSGSFVYDMDGGVCGMLWGGLEGSVFTYITPIEFILEDVKEVCQAEAKLLV